jgi:purine-cytosine permease-like protein
MNTIKKIAGVIWIALGPLAIYYLVTTAASEIRKKPVLDTKIQWIVFVIIFVPIALGIMIFGYYSIKGGYDQLPQKSQGIGD